MQKNYDNHPLDLSYLTEMVGDDPIFMIQVFDTFIEQTPFYMAELEDGLSKRDWMRVANAAHKIKPTFSYIGRNDVFVLVQTIETNARNEYEVDAIVQKVVLLKALVEGIYAQLNIAMIEVRQKYNL